MRGLSRVERARRYLIQELQNGGQRLGSAINIKDVSAVLGTSSTPVREALERLAGEGMVIAGRDERGFTVPRYVARDLSTLYGMLNTVLQIAYRDMKPVTSGEVIPFVMEQGQPALSIESVFSVIASQTKSQVLSDEIHRFINILAPYRIHEPYIIPNWLEDLKALRASLLARDKFEIALRRHTKLRTQWATTMIDAAERSGGSQIY